MEQQLAETNQPRSDAGATWTRLISERQVQIKPDSALADLLIDRAPAQARRRAI